MGEKWIIRNAFFCNKEGCPIEPSIYSGVVLGWFCLAGQVFGREGSEGGTWKITSEVKEVIYDGSIIKEVITESGSTYQVTFSSEYEEFLAATRSGQQILYNWTLYRVHGGYKILGHDRAARQTICGLVVAQDGNWLTIEVIPRGHFFQEKGDGERLRLFVCWPSMCYKTIEERCEEDGKVCGLDTEESFGQDCRPIIPC